VRRPQYGYNFWSLKLSQQPRSTTVSPDEQDQ
jgi:hypothetical protein